MRCPDCGEECELGRYYTGESYNLLSVKKCGAYIELGIHFSCKEYGHCSSIEVSKKKLLEFIENDILPNKST